MSSYFFFQAEDGIRDVAVTGVQTCALPISVYCRHHRASEWHRSANYQLCPSLIASRGAKVSLLKHLEIKTVANLRRLDLATLEGRFGRYGVRLYELARGIDNREVVPDRPTQSISAEDTF